jgi:LacI family transcriptional regulator
VPISQQTTIKEIAERAGVSKQTVSRVVNDRPDVSTETRQKVQGIIDELGYQPSELALDLARGRTSTIGVITSGIQYYGQIQMLAGVEESANSLGYSLSLSLLRGQDDDHIESVLRRFKARRVAGIIWVATSMLGEQHRREMAQLEAMRMPSVVRGKPHPRLSTVETDNRAGAMMAIRHLIEQGYRTIGIIMGSPENWVAQERKRGWQQALQTASLPVDSELVVEGDWSSESGAKGLEKLQGLRPDLDAVFASNDQVALGVLHAAESLGRLVPQDLGVIGFNDLPDAQFFNPALSTINIGLVQMGRMLVQELDSVIRAGNYGDEREIRAIVTKPKLVIRSSTNKKLAQEVLVKGLPSTN